MGGFYRTVIFFFCTSLLLQAGKFRTLAFSPEVTISECLLQVGEETQPIDLPRMNLSKSYDLPVDRNLVFGQKNEAGKFRVLATKRVPEGLNDVVVLVFKRKGKKGHPYNLYLINFDKEKVNFGQTLVINTTKEKVDANLGKLNLMITPGKQVLIDERKIEHQNGRYYVNFRSQINGKWRPLCKTFWSVDPNIRRLAFMIRDPTSKRLRMFCFPDRREAQQE